MVIETYDKTYTVVKHNVSGIHKDIYICRNSEDHQLYTLVCIKDKKVTNKIIQFLCKQKKNKKFSDLIENFVYEENFYIVFAYAEGMSLEKRLKQNCSLEERMEIGKKLLEKMVLFHLPYYFQCQCLKMENIVLTDALDVKFQYNLEKIEEYHSYTWQTASAYLYHILKSLFVKELKNNVLDPMKEFLDIVQKGKENDYLKIYQKYCNVCEKIKKIPQEELQTPRNWIFRLWEKIKSFRGVIKGVMLTLIFICVFVYMIYSIYMSLQIKGYKKNFESIGTVQIKEGELEEEEE